MTWEDLATHTQIDETTVAGVQVLVGESSLYGFASRTSPAVGLCYSKANTQTVGSIGRMVLVIKVIVVADGTVQTVGVTPL